MVGIRFTTNGFLRGTFLFLLLCSTAFFPAAALRAATETELPEAASAGLYRVKVRSFSWFDHENGRRVPFKMYYPLEPAARCPIILFSHGLGGSYSDCAYLGTAWARQGLISIHLQHLGSDHALWDQRGGLRTLREFRNAYAQCWSGRSRAEEMRFIIDRLEELVAHDPMLAEMLDLDRIGVAGYNLGALASLLLAGQQPPDGRESLDDPRVTAVIALGSPINRSPQGFRAAYAGIDSPCLFINGSNDNSIVGSTTAPQRRIPFDAISENERFLVTLLGADHMSYTGRRPLRSSVDTTYYATIARLTTSFWRAYLLDDGEARNDWTTRRPPLGRVGTFERKLSEKRIEQDTDGELGNMSHFSFPTVRYDDSSPAVE